MKILLLCRYDESGASSRFRFFQYLPYLQAQGFEIEVAPFFDSTYVQRLYAGESTAWEKILKSYVRRLKVLFYTQKYDLIWLEKELFPWMPAWFEIFLKKHRTPYVVDYDDAWFHLYDKHRLGTVRRLLGKKIDVVMRNAALVIAGNEYLADRAYRSGSTRVEILPTVIDLERYPVVPRVPHQGFVIGWIGSPSTSHFMKLVQPALKIMSQEPGVSVVTVGAGSLDLEGVRIERRPWFAETEASEIQKFDVGIMPLPDTPFERGKCGFKLIQYMGCSRPVVGSPVGVNQQLIQYGLNGFQASNTEQWVTALSRLKNAPELRIQMGNSGRTIVENEYCLQVAAPQLKTLLQEASMK